MTMTLRTTDLIEAAPEDVGMSTARLQHVSALAQRYVDSGRWAGAISMIARAGSVVHFETFGQRDAEAGLPMTPDTIFRMASMTKPIASLALMQLYEEARFLLDAPVADFVPAFKGLPVYVSGSGDSYFTRTAKREMTIRDLLMHTSGLTGAGESTPVGRLYAATGRLGTNADPKSTMADTVATLATLPLACDPGAQFNYGISTDVVGHLVELISGQTLAAYLEERLFEPLGMADTGFHVPASKRDRFAALYRQASPADAEGRDLRTRDDGSADARYAEGGTYFSGAGGLTSTAADYMQFAKMLANGGELDGERIVGARTLEYMVANHLPGGVEFADIVVNPLSTWITKGTGFGLGFAVLMDPVKAGVLGTEGEYYWNGAFSTSFFVSPNEDLIAILLTQLGGSTYEIRREWRSTVYQAITE
ncbi:MAG: serine hydrolase [Chloroflexi bacterium]|nr:serine hydrolase [Chloroflexota bacterium]